MRLTTDRGDAERYPRLMYAAKFVFGDADVKVHYGLSPAENAVFVPRKSELLFARGVSPVSPPEDCSDLFFAVFYFLTEYDCWSGAVGTDAHGRYRDEERTAVRKGWTDEPFLDAAIEQLTGRREEFRLVPTLDVDGPWKYKHKPFWVRWGGMLKGDVPGRMRVECGGPDPYEAWERIRRFPPQTILFWLLGGQTPYDTRYRANNPHVRKLIRSLPFEAGVHPSYNAAFSSDLLVQEIEALSQIVGRAVEKSRMHFLRYRLPYTHRALVEAGIREDYTTCMPAVAGFKYGTARPFPWFDVEKNVETALMLVPTLWMDRTFLTYEKLTPAAAAARASAIAEKARLFGGHAAVLLHPPSLAGADEWAGWESLADTVV
jgi:hypothetical protein